MTVNKNKTWDLHLICELTLISVSKEIHFNLYSEPIMWNCTTKFLLTSGRSSVPASLWSFLILGHWMKHPIQLSKEDSLLCIWIFKTKVGHSQSNLDEAMENRKDDRLIWNSKPHKEMCKYCTFKKQKHFNKFKLSVNIMPFIHYDGEIHIIWLL